jgi:chaperonin GroES
MTPLQPRGERILLQRVAEKNKKGSIFLAESYREKPQYGTVIAVGEKVEGVIAGDLILIGKYSGTEIPVNDQTYIFAHQDEVLGTVVDPEFREYLLAPAEEELPVRAYAVTSDQPADGETANANFEQFGSGGTEAESELARQAREAEEDLARRKSFEQLRQEYLGEQK